MHIPFNFTGNGSHDCSSGDKRNTGPTPTTKPTEPSGEMENNNNNSKWSHC